jgi:hypothetical protein
MTSGTCLIIRPANFGTRVEQSRFPKFVIDISSGVRHFFLVCAACAVLVRSFAALCGAVRCCAAHRPHTDRTPRKKRGFIERE